jgi:hypothetical protein
VSAGRQKLIVNVQDAPSVDDLVAWAREVAPCDGVWQAEVEWLDAATHQAHTRKPVRFFAFASLWIDERMVHDVLSSRPPGSGWYRVRERWAFDRSARPYEARRWAGVKKTTFWTAVEGVPTDIWQARYTNHGEIAKAYHRTCARYRQNVIIEGSDATLDAVSELWWTNTEDLVERFYVSEEAQRLLAVDTSGFVDASLAHPTVTQHEVLRVGSTETAGGAW